MLIVGLQWNRSSYCCNRFTDCNLQGEIMLKGRQALTGAPSCTMGGGVPGRLPGSEIKAVTEVKLRLERTAGSVGGDRPSLWVSSKRRKKL